MRKGEKQKMKKLIALSLLLCCLAGAAMADTYGLGVYTTLSSASSAYEKDGTAYDGKYEVYTNVCHVVLDEEGKIVDVWFDAVQTKLGFTTKGEVKNEAGSVVASKVELKEKYGMATYVPTAKGEWYQQVRALEQYCIGKTVAEVLSTPATASGVLEVEDLKSSCTIGVTDLLKALEMAAANAR